jgi:hypothetical protein
VRQREKEGRRGREGGRGQSVVRNIHKLIYLSNSILERRFLRHCHLLVGPRVQAVHWSRLQVHEEVDEGGADGV